MKYLFPDIIVESKTNNSQLVKALRNLEDTENRYIIVLDRSFDNIQAVREYYRMRRFLSQMNNVFELSIVCFEYLLLEFDMLLDWIFAVDDEFRTKRKKLILVREKLLDALRGEQDYKEIPELREYSGKIDTMNIEQLASKLLYSLTRNTGFEVSKAKLGECWIVSCCEWRQRKLDDICGLDDCRITIKEKMQEIVRHTVLYDEFARIGLEVTA